MFGELLEAGARRSGRSLDDFEMAPTVSTYVSEDREAARNLMRPVLALYIGGMGSRKQNFYNQLVERYGFEDAAVKVQDLYLDGKKDEAAAALPDELIDLITLCGPKDHVRDRLAAFRDAGVGTLTITPMAFTRRSGSSSCGRSPSWPLERAARSPPLVPGRVRRARSRVPDARARRAAGRARPRGHVRDLVAVARARRAGRDAVRLRARVPAVPGPGERFEMYEAVVRATGQTRRAVADAAPHAVVHDILTLAPAMAGELEGVPVATLIPHLYPVGAPRVPAVRARRAAAAHAARPAGLGRARAAARGGTAPGPRRSERCPGPAGAAAGRAAPRRVERAAVHGRDVPPARVPARLARRCPRRRAADVGAAVRGGRAAARRRAARARGAVDRPGSRAPAAPGRARGPARRAGPRARDVEPAAAGRAGRRPAERPPGRVDLVLADDAAVRARDLPRRPRDAWPGRSPAAARCWPSRTSATWPRTRRGPIGPASGCGCRGGCSRRPRSGSRCGARCREPQARGSGRELAAWTASDDGAARAADLVERLALGLARPGQSAVARGPARTNSISSGASPSTTSIGSPEQLHSSTTARASVTSSGAPDRAVKLPVLEL